MTNKNNVIGLNGIVDPSGQPVSFEDKAKAFLTEYQRLCNRYQLQLKPTYIFSGAQFEARLDVEAIVNEPAN